jgi:amidohydrolase
LGKPRKEESVNKFLQCAENLKPAIVAWRREIHANPEVGMDLPKTLSLVRRELEKMGCVVRDCGGGLTTVIEGSEEGRTFLLRADMDALPMAEESGLDYASVNPKAAHTCGHDAHTAMLLGAAKILLEYRASIKGRVKLMFQPAEELGTGTRSMIADGLLENPPVSAALGLHAMVAMGLNTGELGWYDGPALASGDMFRIDVIGKGTHGSRPETGIDPINILCHIQSMLQTITSREKPQKEAVVLMICQISAGDAPNVVPSRGFMSGTLRTYNQEIREFVKRRVKEIAQGTAASLGGSAEVTFNLGMAPTINNRGICASLKGYYEELLGEKKVIQIPSQMASEDFSEVLNRVPGAFFRLGMGSKGEGYVHDGHNPRVVFNEDALPIGAAVYAYGAVRWLEDQDQKNS